jgi:hypothetical protein
VPKTFSYNQASLKQIEGIWVMHLEETDDFKRGYEQGILLKKVNHRSYRFLKNIFIRAYLYSYAFIKRKELEKLGIPKSYLDELKGIHKATGISSQILLFLNFGFDVILRTILCSSFNYMDKNTQVIGRNTDVHPILGWILLKLEGTMIYHISNKHHSYSHVGFAFVPGVLNGYNHNGIAVNSHLINSTLDNKILAKGSEPLITTLSSVLKNTSTIQDAEQLLNHHAVSRSVSVLVTSINEEKSFVFEGHPKEKTITYSSHHYTCATMHFDSEKMKNLQFNSSASEIRMCTLKGLLDKLKNPTTQNLINILKNSEHGLKKYYSGGKSIANKGTFQSFLMYPLSDAIIISNGRKTPVSQHGKFIELSMTKLKEQN